MFLKSLGTAISFCVLVKIVYSWDLLFLLFSNAMSLGVLGLVSWHIGAYLSRALVANFFARVNGKGKIVVITGCDTGFGNVSALRLNSLGFTVYATCLFPEGKGGQSLLRNARYPQNMNVLRMDVTSDKEIDAVYTKVEENIANNNGQMYGLLNNAGIPKAGHLELGKFEELQAIFDVNTFGQVRVTRKFLPLIRAAKGRIVNMASTAGKHATIAAGAYSMTKAAIMSFTECLRREMYRFDVKVIELVPMFYRTNIIDCEATTAQMDRTWLQTSKQVREDYGERYFIACKKAAEVILTSPMVNKNVDEVSAAVEDAFCSQYPNPTYILAAPIFKLHYWLLVNFYPSEVVEIFSSMYAMIIDYHHDKS